MKGRYHKQRQKMLEEEKAWGGEGGELPWLCRVCGYPGVGAQTAVVGEVGDGVNIWGLLIWGCIFQNT